MFYFKDVWKLNDELIQILQKTKDFFSYYVGFTRVRLDIFEFHFETPRKF